MDTRVPLAALRVRMRYTQEEVARDLGISRSTLMSWERNSANMPLKYMPVFARMYDFPIDQIFFGDTTALSEELRRKAVDDENHS